MATIEAKVAAPEGLHARPAALFARAVAKSGKKVLISKGDSDKVDASSTLSMMTLGAKCGDIVTLECTDDKAEDVLADLKKLVENPEP